MASRMSEAEKDALKSAAETAKTVLPKLLEEQENLNKRIGTMEAIVAAYDASQGKRDKTNGGVSDGSPEDPPKRRRAKKGQIAEQIADVLTGRELELREIRDAIQERFDTKYARNTVLTVLQREQGRFHRVSDEKKWSVKPLVLVSKAS
jgi:hypothetical protein